MIRIILAEDHSIVRNGVKSLLSSAGFEITGEAFNGQEVLNLLNEGVKADIILTDIHMPVMTGLELIDRLMTAENPPKVIILTMLDHESYITKAFEAGAAGYILKNINSDELFFAVKHVHQSGKYICSELAFRFLERRISELKVNEAYPDLEITKREAEVLAMIADGMTNQEIADKLFTSKRTVEGHRQNLLDKTGARNTASLIRFAVIKGMIK